MNRKRKALVVRTLQQNRLVALFNDVCKEGLRGRSLFYKQTLLVRRVDKLLNGL